MVVWCIKKVFTDSKGKIVSENMYISQKKMVNSILKIRHLRKTLGADLARNVFGLERRKLTPKYTNKIKRV